MTFLMYSEQCFPRLLEDLIQLAAIVSHVPGEDIPLADSFHGVDQLSAALCDCRLRCYSGR